jgi:hypothetical protein
MYFGCVTYVADGYNLEIDNQALIYLDLFKVPFSIFLLTLHVLEV